MAGSSLLVLLDDIAAVLDDVAVMTKAATKKTAGVLGDDLALNAQQVTGVRPAREIPVVWAVAKGSFINKAILVPAALAISFFVPWLITPLLMLGGAFLCFEGAEKLVHRFLHKEQEEKHRQELREALKKPEVDLKAVEKGLPNLLRHIENLSKFGIPTVVALNRFPTDTKNEITKVQKRADDKIASYDQRLKDMETQVCFNYIINEKK